jgi:LAS superfamily LD-carboxypeptidase LdcB
MTPLKEILKDKALSLIPESLHSEEQILAHRLLVQVSRPAEDVDDAQTLKILNALTEKSREVSFDPKGILKSGELHPELVKRLQAFLNEAWQNDLHVFIFEGARSFERQNQLFQAGQVTKAAAGKSFHNYGLAADIVFYGPQKKPSWDAKQDWQKLGKLGEKHGLTWGGRFQSIKDFSHFEYHPGLGIEKTKEIYDSEGLKSVWKKISAN